MICAVFASRAHAAPVADVVVVWAPGADRAPVVAVARGMDLAVLKLEDEAGGDEKLITVPVDTTFPYYTDVGERGDLPSIVLAISVRYGWRAAFFSSVKRSGSKPGGSDRRRAPACPAARSCPRSRCRRGYGRTGRP